MRNLTPVVFLAVVTACSRAPEPAPSSSSSPASPASASPTAAAGSPAAAAHAEPAHPENARLALQWLDPPRWQRKTPSTAMRAAEYAVPHAAGDADDGECIVITFGPGQGGGIDDNVNRWVAQFAGATTPARTEREVHGLKVTRVETAGTYTPMRMPGMPAAPVSKPGWRLVGEIVEAPSGFWFFKLTGPDATVKAAAPELDSMIATAAPRQ